MSATYSEAEWKAWGRAAGEEVARYVRSGQMKLVSMSDVRRSLKSAPDTSMAASKAPEDHLDERQLSGHQQQVIAGVGLGLSDTTIARNLKLTPPVVKRMRGRLKRMGFL